ncbi:MAG: glycoside hydrolase family 3 C-terminal domain-containing protein [Salinivirgaceae bacterium]|jgi:beta-glucosidase|nr:glycoside hydrolase family 3 C-terminal domain-containing protein [Salinivirgaceae bacterium]
MKAILSLTFISFFILLIGCSTQSEKVDVEQEIEAILKQLTLKEKVDLCHAQSKFSTKGVARLGIPEIWMSDGPHGVRAEIAWDSWDQLGWTNDSCTAFPALTCLAASFNEKLSYKYGKAIGEEARYRKKEVLLAPGINIYRTPLNGRNFEYMGEDPYLASKMVVPYVKGVQGNGVAACVKHFALNNQEKWRGHINVNISERALREIYLPAHKASVIEGGAWAIMGAYNKFRGQHCCHNEELNNKILKGEWGFDGVVISDWGGVHDTKEAALYGMDMEMGTWTDGLHKTKYNAYDNYHLAMPFYEKIKNGEIDESVVDDKVRRILRLMYRTCLNKERPLGSFATQEHFNTAREIAQEGIVLLKNENNFFPINPEAKLKIAVIGHNATHPMTIGGGSSELKTHHEISPLEGIKARFKNAEILYSMGYSAGIGKWWTELPSPYNADSLKTEALKVAKEADLVLFIGGLNKNLHQDSEGTDRKSLNLSYGQDELIEELNKVNEKVGVILVTGNAVAMPWINQVDAVLQTWYLGSEAGNAIADVISGDVNPSGKLPFTFPVRLEDNGAISFGELSYPGDSINQYYKEDIYVGYRWHETKNIKPLFAFGFGLSYSDFEIKESKISKKQFSSGEKLIVNCTVSNTGTIDGAEVVQVYIGKVNSKVDRAVKELKGFKKVFVKGNNDELVSVTIDIDELAFWNEEIDGWELEKGEYFIAIGNSSDNISTQIPFEVN